MAKRSLRFLGAAGSVTGSRHLLTTDSEHYLIDCGLFQGARELRQRNWQPLPLDLATLGAVVLTHAHLDHTGYLPRLVRDGYRGPVHASLGTSELMGVLLPDSGRLQEEDAEFRNRHRLSRHDPALPLYTEQDARRALALVQPQPLETPLALSAATELRLRRAAHILGSCFAEFRLGAGADACRVLFTGDLGRLRRGPSQTLASGPETPEAADYLVMESTYGDRLHPDDNVGPRLAAALSAALGRGGVVVIPAFAVERTQKLLFLIKHLMEEGQVPRAPLHLDSPMALAAIEIFLRHAEEFNDATRELIRRYGPPQRWEGVFFDRTPQASRAINAQDGPMIIISSSGMATGGRVVHHLAQRLPDARNMALFVGYQSPGTLGFQIKTGKNPLFIHKQEVPVRAEIAAFEEFSDHADAEEMIAWLRQLPRPPRRIFLVHGEPAASAALAARIRAELGWEAHPAQWLEEVPLP